MPLAFRPRLPRRTRARRHGAAAPPAPERTQPHIERLSHGGIDWIHIEEPGPLERAWLAEHFDFHALDIEDVMSRNQRPKIDQYPDYLFIVLHFPIFDKQVGRLNAGELDLFVGPDFLITIPNQPLQPINYLFDRWFKGLARSWAVAAGDPPVVPAEKGLHQKLLGAASLDHWIEAWEKIARLLSRADPPVNLDRKQTVLNSFLIFQSVMR